MLKRFNRAAERCYTTLIEKHHFFEAQVAFSIQHFYQSVFMRAWHIQKSQDADYHLPLEMHYAVDGAIKLANKL